MEGWVLCVCVCVRMHARTCVCTFMNIMLVHVYVGHKAWIAQSVDCSMQSVDPCFARRSMDCLLNPRTVQFTVRKVQICERSTT